MDVEKLFRVVIRGKNGAPGQRTWYLPAHDIDQAVYRVLREFPGTEAIEVAFVGEVLL